MLVSCHSSLRTIFLKTVIASLLAACGGSGGPADGAPAVTPVIIKVEPKLQQAFRVDQAKNNQGLANWNGFYYVGYDIGSGNGYLERYSKDGVLDPDYGRVSVPTRHTAELAYRAADSRIYAASGGGTEPTYVYRLAADGKSVDRTYDFTAYGNAAMIAIDNTNDVLVLSTTAGGGDAGAVTFRFIDWNANNKVINQFTIPSQGVPQGVEVYGGLVYFYTSSKITVLDNKGTILDSWDLKAAGESQGMTIVLDGTSPYLAVGYNAPQRVYTIRPIELGANAPTGKHFVLIAE
jgi:hypothetical protein